MFKTNQLNQNLPMPNQPKKLDTIQPVSGWPIQPTQFVILRASLYKFFLTMKRLNGENDNCNKKLNSTLSIRFLRKGGKSMHNIKANKTNWALP